MAASGLSVWPQPFQGTVRRKCCLHEIWANHKFTHLDLVDQRQTFLSSDLLNSKKIVEREGHIMLKKLLSIVCVALGQMFGFGVTHAAETFNYS
jgi:hypothetical protein